MAILVNGERVAIVDSSSIRAEGDDSFEVEGNDSSAYYLTELAQVDPKGRWRFHLEGRRAEVPKEDVGGVGDIRYLHHDRRGGSGPPPPAGTRTGSVYGRRFCWSSSRSTLSPP